MGFMGFKATVGVAGLTSPCCKLPGCNCPRVLDSDSAVYFRRDTE